MESNPFIKWSLCFFFYCFIGWIWETGYVFVRTGQWENRGFLHGPFLPIYGFGALVILWFTTPAKGNVWLIFLLGMLGATLLEYLGGILLEQIFHARYWDYSGVPLNLNGHVCLPCSFVWGLFSILLVKWIHGWVNGWVISIPVNFGFLIAMSLILLVSADFIYSTKEALQTMS